MCGGCRLSGSAFEIHDRNDLPDVRPSLDEAVSAITPSTLIENSTYVLNILGRIGSTSVCDRRSDTSSVCRNLPQIAFVYSNQFCGFRRRKISYGLFRRRRKIIPLMRLQLLRQIMSVTLNQRSELSHRGSSAVGLARHFEELFLMSQSCGVLRSFAFRARLVAINADFRVCARFLVLTKVNPFCGLDSGQSKKRELRKPIWNSNPLTRFQARCHIGNPRLT